MSQPHLAFSADLFAERGIARAHRLGIPSIRLREDTIALCSRRNVLAGVFATKPAKWIIARIVQLSACL